MNLTDAQRELLEDKFLLWDRASREGSLDLRDYNKRAADALKAALSICSDQGAAQSHPNTNEIGDDPEMGPVPKPGEIRVFDGKRHRFIERELEGDKWEVLGPSPPEQGEG